jgi:hypothetical protein
MYNVLFIININFIPGKIYFVAKLSVLLQRKTVNMQEAKNCSSQDPDIYTHTHIYIYIYIHTYIHIYAQSRRSEFTRRLTVINSCILLYSPCFLMFSSNITYCDFSLLLNVFHSFQHCHYCMAMNSEEEYR